MQKVPYLAKLFRAILEKELPKLVSKHSCAFSRGGGGGGGGLYRTMQYLKHLFSSFSLCAELHSCVDLRHAQNCIDVLICAVRKAT